MKYQNMAKQARTGLRIIATASTDKKNEVLSNICENIDQRKNILNANAIDIKNAKEVDLDEALLDRLELNNQRIDAMIEGISQIISLPDPIGEISQLTRQPSGIEVGMMRQPLGVIGIIYESRPNVTVDAAALCLKSGNACILRGGSEAFNSNQAIAECISKGLISASLPDHIVQVAPTTERSFVGEMIAGSEPLCDIVIPRGGKGLIQRISKDACIPVIKHLDGNCHVYVDSEANLDDALNILENAKTHRYGVCNAAESFLIHKDIADVLLPKLAKVLDRHEVEIRGCERVCELLAQASAATSQDWTTEYLAPIVAIAVIDSVDEAVSHINYYGSHHTDAIVSNNYSTVRNFVAAVDSASVIVNASTRFADGFEYGLGAEIGISTDRIHVRGPVGLIGLTNQKWVVFGNGEVRR